MIDPNQYTQAFNVELVGNGNFYSLTNIDGTTEEGELTGLPSSCEILKIFPNKYIIDGTQYRCITIFTAVAESLFKIWCFNTETGDLYELFEENITADYLTDDRAIDATNYPENGIDILYFTDNYNEVRYLKCQIDFPYTPNFLSSYAISLLRKGANGTIELDAISATGGSLLSGSYQFSYRMADPLNKRFTKWSTLTNPIHIYSADNSDESVYAGIGLQTTRKITLDVTPSEIELSNFEYIQLAVVENVGVAAPTTADLLEIVLADDPTTSYEYKANTSIGTILLEDITVDLAQLQTVKTLAVKQNRLIGGNVTYTTFEFNGGAVDNNPPVPTIPLALDWDNVSPGLWAYISYWSAFVAGNGNSSGYLAGAVTTLAGYQYSFNFDFEIFVSGVTTPSTSVTFAILDASYNEITTYTANYTSAGTKTQTVILTPSSAGTYLGIKIVNNTPFEDKVYKFTSASYNTPSASTSSPSVTGGSIITQASTSPDSYSSDDFSSRYIGYFRDEVYRFGIVYTDENGNKSPVSPLDLNGIIVDNQITAPLPDVKFPDRSVNPDYALINTDGGINAMGLRLTGVKNHPSTASSFEIVRLPRKKNILFQTPIVPMFQLTGTGALSQYPATSYVPSGPTSIVAEENPNAQPMSAGITYVPKNLFWPELRQTEKTTTTVSSGYQLLTSYLKGEVKLTRKATYDYAMIFPPQFMYGNTEDPYVFVGNEKLNTVDYALLKCEASLYGTPPTTSPSSTTGEYADTSIIGSFFAVGDAQYYYDAVTGSKSIDTQFRNMPVVDYEAFENYGAPASVAGVTVLDYESFQTSGVTLGYKPDISKCAVVKLQSPVEDLNSTGGGITFRNGTLNSISPGSYIFAASGPQYDTQVGNKYVVQYAGYTNSSGPSGGSNISAVPIANMVLGLGDDRYGNLNSFGEYVSTGAKYSFTEAEIDQLRSGIDVTVDIDVWGGDCIISYHSFKVTDSTYSVVNQNKYYSVACSPQNNVLRWNRTYSFGGNSTISMPVAVKNAAQFIQVLLESEYNGGVRDIDTLATTTNVDVPRIQGDNESDARTPLTYKYNTNLWRGNTQKVYFPKLEYSFEQDEFAARLVYSDVKIYNSDQAGFDIFRVGNIYDLEEIRYGITKLAVGFDQLYAIQEQGVTYIPTGSQQIEQTTGGELSVRSNEVIGRPVVIDTKRGSQHIKGVVETGGVIYIPDNQNKTIYVLAEQQLRAITKNNETIFREVFANKIPEKNVIGIYDPVKRQYWFVDNENDECHIYNEPMDIWVASHEFTNLKAGAFTNDNLWLIGNNTINTMYTGPVGELFGITVVPRVTVVVNPDESLSKTFDDMMISASQRLESMDMVVERETELGDQTIPTISLDDMSIEGNYRIKVLRDSDDARARGLRAFVTITWKEAVKSALQAAWTKYRLSARTPW